MAAATITTEDGTTLEAPNELLLAWAWAEHEHTPEEWAALTYGQQCVEVSAAHEALDAPSAK